MNPGPPPSSPASLTIALVGLGYWGPNLLRVLIDQADVEVSWICDPDVARLERHERHVPGVRQARALAQVLEDPELDAVVLATPVFTHYELAERCLRAGKHVFVEKPLAATSERAAELISLSGERNLVLMCGHTFLYSAPVRAIGELIRTGQLGDIYFVSSSRVNLGLHQRDVSVIWDLGPHDFSILLYWLGELPSIVTAAGRDSVVPGITDVAFVNMQFGSGLIASIELSWLAPSKLRRTVVVGSERMVLYEDGAADAIRIYDSGVDYKDPESFGEYQLSYRSGDVSVPKLSTVEPLVLQMEDFARAVRDGHGPPGHLQIARDVVRLAEASELSLHTGRSVDVEQREVMS
jgi:predicted dehydrogenase